MRQLFQAISTSSYNGTKYALECLRDDFDIIQNKYEYIKVDYVWHHVFMFHVSYLNL